VATRPEVSKAPASTSLKQTVSNAGTETYSVQSILPPKDTASRTTAPKPEPIVIEDDDTTIPVKIGAPCKRKGCFTVFVSNEVNRTGEGEGTVCMYHPMPVSGADSPGV
jgi:hypothetical protein